MSAVIALQDLRRPSLPMPVTIAPAQLLTELQTLGLRLEDAGAGASLRKGGAGPTDHKAIQVHGRTLMVPVLHAHARRSPYLARRPDAEGRSRLERDGVPIAALRFPPQPRFYSGTTADGVPYWKIAQLHGSDVLATTVLQTCIRYGRRSTSCQFCAIGESLKEGRTVNHKTPAMLAEVARAAVELDGVRHMVMTTGTPNFTDRGAAILCESAHGVKAAVPLPIQAQCEPPDDPAWFARLRDAGVDALGMHLEAVTPAVRARIMPGKASVSLDEYFRAFEDAVAIFGRGQVSTYILAGLGDTVDAILSTCATLVRLGVYPFVVPFVPVGGTPLADHPPPDAATMQRLLGPLARMLVDAGLTSADIKAGCGKCGACSSLASHEQAAAKVIRHAR